MLTTNFQNILIALKNALNARNTFAAMRNVEFGSQTALIGNVDCVLLQILRLRLKMKY